MGIKQNSKELWFLLAYICRHKSAYKSSLQQPILEKVNRRNTYRLTIKGITPPAHTKSVSIARSLWDAGTRRTWGRAIGENGGCESGFRATLKEYLEGSTKAVAEFREDPMCQVE